jgi:hypothetical protein
MTYPADDILTSLDRMSIGASSGAHVPGLDCHILAFVSVTSGDRPAI